MTGRGGIGEVLRLLNEAENRRPERSVEETIAGIDSVMANDVEGWRNGTHVPNREAERQTERILFGVLADYHRTFDRVIIEPPLASVAWTITGTANGTPLSATGCSNFEIDENGKIRRYWLYVDLTPFSALAQ
jgi:ketosteroid isomerase-like protein